MVKLQNIKLTNYKNLNIFTVLIWIISIRLINNSSTQLYIFEQICNLEIIE